MSFKDVIATIGTIFTIGSIVAGALAYVIVEPGKSPQRKHVFIIVVGIAMVLSIVVGAAVVISNIPQGLAFPAMPTALATTQPTSPSSSGSQVVLTPQEVQKWCSPIPGEAGPCDISRFEQLPLSNGVVDPKAVHMKANGAVKITIPQGFSAYIWPCTGNGFSIIGPSVQPHVCEMKVWINS